MNQNASGAQWRAVDLELDLYGLCSVSTRLFRANRGSGSSMDGPLSTDGPPAHAGLPAMHKGRILGSIKLEPVLGIKLLFKVPVAVGIVRCPH